MKSLAAVLIVLFLMAFAVGCKQEVGAGNKNEGTKENYEDPNYQPSYMTEGGEGSTPN